MKNNFHRFIFTFIGGIFTVNHNFSGPQFLIYEVINQVTEAKAAIKKETQNHGGFNGLEKTKLGFSSTSKAEQAL